MKSLTFFSTTILCLAFAQNGLGLNARRCRKGLRLSSAYKMLNGTANEWFTIAVCELHEHHSCNGGCQWQNTCRQMVQWAAFGNGTRTYVAGLAVVQDDRFQLYCCTSMSNIVENPSSDCRWTEAVQPIDKANGVVVNLHVMAGAVDFVETDTVTIRDVLPNPDIDDEGRRSYKVEICKIKSERDKCDLNAMGDDENKEFKSLMMTNERAAFLNTNERFTDRTLDDIKKEVFTDLTNLRQAAEPVAVTNGKRRTTRSPKTRKTTAEQLTTQTTANSDDYYKYNYDYTTPDYEQSDEVDTTARPTRPPLTAPKATSCPKRDWSQCVSDREASRQFRSCCKRTGVDAACHHLCTYESDEDSVDTIIEAVVGDCPPEKFETVLGCASQQRDASECCNAQQLYTDPSLAVCQPFCNPSNFPPGFDFMDIRFLVCLDRLPNVIECFKSYLN